MRQPGTPSRRRFIGWAALALAVVILLPIGAYLIVNVVNAPKSSTPVAADASDAPSHGAASAADAVPRGGPAPTVPLRVCGNPSLVRGPASPPAGAIRIPAGDNSAFEDSFRLRPGRIYWLAPGVHTLGPGKFDQIQPDDGDTFIGAPGAVLSGQGQNNFAFASSASDVKIEYLTIEGFIPPAGQGAVNQDLSPRWQVLHSTVQGNAPGAGIMMAGGGVTRYSCLTKNGEYGFNAVAAPTGAGRSPLTGGPDGIALDHNEISYNDTCNLDNASPNPVPDSEIPPICRGTHQPDGCGCAGGGKFWEVQNATIDSNYVHNNYDVGLWADTNDNGFTVTHNYISDNYGEAIIYEISYNALIVGNTFIRNAIGAGPANPGFPTGAVYISESGGDGRVPNSAGIKTLTIARNVFADNWSGVVLWESADRFCGSPNNTSTGTCTLVGPAVANTRSCTEANLRGATAAQRPDYYGLCRWKTQNVSVRNNKFSMDSSAVPHCRGAANSCGENAIFSQFGTSPGWSPYKGPVIERAITRSRGNTFSANVYSGSWEFLYRDQSGVLTAAQWRAAGQD